LLATKVTGLPGHLRGLLTGIYVVPELMKP